MGRNPLYKLTDTQMRNLILKYAIDSEGNKVSVRDIFSNEDFMKASGYYQVTLAGVRVQVSLGSVSFLLRKLKLNSKDIYNYAVKKGLTTEEYHTWANKSKGNRKKRGMSTFIIKSMMIDYFNLDFEECMNMTIPDIKSRAIKEYADLGINEEGFEDDYKLFKEINKLTDSIITRYSGEVGG